MIELRHHCRRCRVKLPVPVGNPLDAFCCPGCFRIHFQSKCLICERKKSGRGLACTYPKCRAELASRKRHATRGKYVEKAIVAHDSGQRRDASKTSNSIALARPSWRQVAGPPLTEAELRWATVPDGGTYRRVEDASRAALVKAGLAFDPARQARQAKVDQAEIEANGCFEDRQWREVISTDGVRCYR